MRSIPAFTLLVAALAAALPAFAQGRFAPAVVYSQAGKNDKSFNESAWQGAERFKKETGVDYQEAQITKDSQMEQVLRSLARNGANPIVAIGFQYQQAIGVVAKEYPDLKFTLVDASAAGDNIQSVRFKQHEGSFLVGVAAAMASRSGKVGFVGGMDIPPIRAFACGYQQGARWVNKDVTVFENMAGSTHQAFSDPARGAELAKSQFDRGADVVFAAAGRTGMGVLQAAKDAGKLSIGVDSNQNPLFPGSVLTSMVKRIDNAVYQSFKAARDGSWKAGTQVLGVKEGGVDWVVDEHNRKLVRPQMEARVQAAAADIAAGKLVVADFIALGSCPQP